MDRRYVIGLVAFVVIGLGLVAFTTVWSPQADSPSSDQTYPAGAGPDHINFSALNADNATVTHTPREYWDSYAIIYTAPPERRLIEGSYYINSTTGEIIGQRWHNATVYINGSTYAFVQPADSIPEHRREQIESNPQFVYDNTTDAYYRYDPHYGQIAPTNIGRHPDILDAYAWTAVNTTTHHGVPVITYRVEDERTTAADVPPAINGTLRLGVEDGIVYAFDITLDGEGRDLRYTYDIHPAPFPDHSWVDTAREAASADT
ncbi:hypothetical protein VB773_14110 [Haloarculaceae archaeon H-GB2-1]|nr:hypothetical protein [Haloarculaceae archaeon H-GB1-1]MEA5387084.1 hypothetical protein [Haloarculaceae archaeon H-GB11]MEA5408589.1 hypothetical protein [Haloarculaceae archaeon H-GB2-1]